MKHFYLLTLFLMASVAMLAQNQDQVNLFTSVNDANAGKVESRLIEVTIAGDTLNCCQTIALQDSSVKYVQGYVVGWYSTHANDQSVVFNASPTNDTTVFRTNIVIADAASETDVTKVVCVQLPYGPIRDALNLNTNSNVLGAFVKVHGVLTTYCSLPGVKAVDEAWLNGVHVQATADNDDLVGDGSRTNPYTYADVVALNNPATTVWVKAFIVGQVAFGANSLSANTFETANFTANSSGQNTNVLLAAAAGETNVNKVMGLQLPTGAIRDGVNLSQNPTMMGQEVLVYGSLEKYFGKPGIKNPAYVEVIGGANFGQNPDAAVVAPAATVATIAEFNAAAVNSTVPGVYYELTGTVSNVTNTTYGNFTLTDATGSVVVYGLTADYIPLTSATKATNDKSYASLGLAIGDNITIRGVRVTYNKAPEVLGAYFVSKNNAPRRTSSYAYSSTSYDRMDSIEIKATPFYGYHFVRWSDSIAAPVRVFRITQDTTFEAVFAKNIFSVNVHSSDTVAGSVSATSSSAAYQDTVTLTATPNVGYLFSQWSDGNTDNPRQVVVAADLSLTAEFSVKMCTLSLSQNIAEAGTISGAGTYEYGTTVSCIATPLPGYEFIQWSDGETQNPYTFAINSDLTLEAFFRAVVPSVVPDSIIITPDSVSAAIQWSLVDNAASYTLVISKDDETICSLTFDAQGGLVNGQSASASERTDVSSAEPACSFTVTNLLPCTAYAYVFSALNSQTEVIYSESGTFRTNGDTPVDNISAASQTSKVLRDNQIIIIRNGVEYTTAGKPLR